jgi:hypothetical protein
MIGLPNKFEGKCDTYIKIKTEVTDLWCLTPLSFSKTMFDIRIDGLEICANNRRDHLGPKQVQHKTLVGDHYH